MTPKFLDADGWPLPLPLRGSKGSFESLVRRYSSTIPAHTILCELEYANCVDRKSGDMVHLVSGRYLPADCGSPVQLQVLGRGAARLLETGRHNIQRNPDSGEPPFLERQFWVPAVPPDKLPEYRARLRELLKRQFEEARALAEEYEDAIAQEGYHKGAGFGIYYFEETAVHEGLNDIYELED